jgi:small subunit ribosomal protein S6
MRYYEALYIVNPNYEQDRLEAVIKEVDAEVTKFAKVINHYVWGKKRLAYPIEKHKYGTYVLLHMELEDPAPLVEFDRFMRLHKAVLRVQTIRLEKQPEKVEEAKTVLESGDSAPSRVEGRDTAENSEAKDQEETSEEETPSTEGEDSKA